MSKYYYEDSDGGHIPIESFHTRADGKLEIMTPLNEVMIIDTNQLKEEAPVASPPPSPDINEVTAEVTLEDRLTTLAMSDHRYMGQEGLIIAGIGKLIALFREREGKLAQTMLEDVADFHRKFGINYDGTPRRLPTKLRAFRDARLDGEITEYWDAVTEDDVEKQLDAFVDIVYIILGTCHLHGWDFDEAWRRVHRANMLKIREDSKDNQSAHAAISGGNDIVKPQGWTHPVLRDLVGVTLRHWAKKEKKK